MLAVSYEDKWPSTDGTSWLGKYPTKNGGEYFFKLRAGDPHFKLGRVYFSMCCVLAPCTLYYRVKVTTSSQQLQQEKLGSVGKQEVPIAEVV